MEEKAANKFIKSRHEGTFNIQPSHVQFFGLQLKMKHKMKMSIMFLLIIVFLGCTNKQELMPLWVVKVSEKSQLSSIDNKLYLIEQTKTSEINLQSGTKKESTEKIVNNKKSTIGKAGKDNNVNRIKLNNGDITYTLVESFSSTEDCYQSLYKYCVERIDTDYHHSIYRLGKFERVKVLYFD